MVEVSAGTNPLDVNLTISYVSEGSMRVHKLQSSTILASDDDGLIASKLLHHAYGHKQTCTILNRFLPSDMEIKTILFAATLLLATFQMKCGKNNLHDIYQVYKHYSFLPFHHS